MRRNGFGNSHNSGLPQQSALSSPVIDTTPNNASKDQTQRTTFASQSHNDHGHQQARNSFSRSRGGGSHPRGDNSHYHNHGGRRDHDRGNQDWNSNRNFNAQPHRVVHRLMRPPPPPNTAPFIPPPPMRPLGGPIPFSGRLYILFVRFHGFDLLNLFIFELFADFAPPIGSTFYLRFHVFYHMNLPYA